MRSLAQTLMLALALTAVGWSTQTAVAQETLTYPDLVGRMTDLERAGRAARRRRDVQAVVELGPVEPVRRGDRASTSTGTPTTTAPASSARRATAS